MANCIQTMRKALDNLEKSIPSELERDRHDSALLALKDSGIAPDQIAEIMNRRFKRRYTARNIHAYIGQARRRLSAR